MKQKKIERKMTLIFYLMEINLESIVLFLKKKGKSPSEITMDINETLGDDTIKYSTVTNYLRKQIYNPNGEQRKKKDVNPPRFYLRDIVLKTLKDFPFFSIRQISEHTSVPATTVYRILAIDLQYKVKHLKWIPHLLNSEQKAARVEISKSLLKSLKSAEKNNFRFFYTGDESWFYLTTDHTIQWLPPDEVPSFREKKTISSKKFMLTIFWNVNGFPIVNVLPENEKFTANYFINAILEEIYQKIRLPCNNVPRKISLHYDNARPHTARKVARYLETHRMKKVPHPPFSPDIAPSDFYLFGYVKNRLQGLHFDSMESLLENVVEILSEITKDTLKKVFKDWMDRLQKIINNNGEYFE